LLHYCALFFPKSYKHKANKEIYVELSNFSGQVIYKDHFRAKVNEYGQLLYLKDGAGGLFQLKIIIDQKMYLRTMVRVD
jgi:hypothetical protein